MLTGKIKPRHKFRGLGKPLQVKLKQSSSSQAFRNLNDWNKNRIGVNCLNLVILRTPELVGLAHRFGASKVSVFSKFIDKNQIIIFSIKYVMCNIHMNDYYCKYFERFEFYPVSL